MKNENQLAPEEMESLPDLSIEKTNAERAVSVLRILGAGIFVVNVLVMLSNANKPADDSIPNEYLREVEFYIFDEYWLQIAQIAQLVLFFVFLISLPWAAQALRQQQYQRAMLIAALPLFNAFVVLVFFMLAVH